MHKVVRHSLAASILEARASVSGDRDRAASCSAYNKSLDYWAMPSKMPNEQAKR